MDSNVSVSNIESLSGQTNVSFASSVDKNNLSNVAPDEPLLLNETQYSCGDAFTDTLKLCIKGSNIGFLNVQGLCSREMSKFAEIEVMMT